MPMARSAAWVPAFAASTDGGLSFGRNAVGSSEGARVGIKVGSFDGAGIGCVLGFGDGFGVVGAGEGFRVSCFNEGV